jgi:predicted glycosyltransferase
VHIVLGFNIKKNNYLLYLEKKKKRRNESAQRKDPCKFKVLVDTVGGGQNSQVSSEIPR